MATECTQENIVEFLNERGGRVRNSELVAHFKAVFPEEAAGRAAVREAFKNHVDRVAFVRSEGGVRYVCLRRKFRRALEDNSEPVSEEVPDRHRAASDRASGDDAAAPAPHAAVPAPHAAPGSGCGSDSQVRAWQEGSVPGKTEGKRECGGFVCPVEDVDSSSGDMGSLVSLSRDRRDSKKKQGEKVADIPEIAVIEASPLPAEGSVFTLPGPAQTGCTGQVAAAGLRPPDTGPHAEAPSRQGLKGAGRVVTRQNSKGSQHRFPGQPESDGEDDWHLDAHSLSGGEDTPKGSRKHFIEVMMSSSPQVRRSMVFRSSVHLSSRSDSDSASMVSCNLDDDRASVTLDPVEHEWMMCASDGEWGSLQRLLAAEPGLVLRKDFVTGFTCLHWAAKHGKPELIALIVNFAKQHNVPISVDVRSNTGYTPLHIAAMHSHMEVLKLLVGAYNADVEIRDYSGRKACQYLTDNVSVDIQDIIGAYERSEAENADRTDGGRWRFSKVLQSNLKPLKLLSPHDSVDREDRPREKPLRRKSSLSRMKPKLQRLRLRTSQIFHSTSFHDEEDGEGSGRGSFRSRPKTHFFG